MATLTTRRAAAGDAAALQRLLAELGYGDLDPEAFARTFAAVRADPATEVWVAEEDGRVVGLMTLSRRAQLRLAGELWCIDELVVAEGSRGAGVGRRLLALAEEEARRAGARRLELHTARGRESYRRGFYVKNGFREVDSAVLRHCLATARPVV